jgi:hypothetical protein
LSKKTEWSLLVPGPLGWEVWNRQADGGFARREGGDEPAKVSELANLPAGDLALLFPVRDSHALPFRAESTDSSLFDDLATMHAERLGIRPDPMAGKLSDLFPVTADDRSTVLLHTVLKRPGEGDLPLRTPKEFDLSARAYPVEGDTLCVWKEIGRWVFAFHVGGKLLYSQATSSSAQAPDSAVLQEIRLALSQLAMQGLPHQPSAVRVWPPEGELGEAGALADAFASRPRVEARPDPVIPDPLSKLLPEDVRAARIARKRRNQRVAVVTVLLAAYLGAIGWFGYQYWLKSREKQELAAELEELQGGVAGVLAEHNARWMELEPVVDSKLSPLEVMLAVNKVLPKNAGMRLTTADIGVAENRIQLLGTAQRSVSATQFYSGLKNSPDLKWLKWDDEPPQQDKEAGWKFRVSAERPKEDGAPY